MTSAKCLALGGARSGKSHWAEQRLLDRPTRYLATGYPVAAVADDGAWAARIERHRQRRPAHWETIETLDVAEQLRIDDGRAVLVDCLTLWLTRQLDIAGAWDRPAAAAAADLEPVLEDLVAAIAEARSDVIMVSNEVGSGVMPEHPSGRLFADLQGSLNRRVAEQCPEVVLLVAGIPVPVRQPTMDPRGI